jgi:signal transduction histidine kinase
MRKQPHAPRLAKQRSKAGVGERSLAGHVAPDPLESEQQETTPLLDHACPTLVSGDGSVPLESILCTEELALRPPRPPDYEKETRALVSLVRALAESPGTILQALADTILELFEAGSAGVSLLTREDGGKRFYWPAIAGSWKEHIGGGTPRNFGPCGDVLDRNVPLMFRHVERRYTYFLPVKPPVEECLLVPFYVRGEAVGTIWMVAHDERRKFDAEDMRQLISLGSFASSAYQAMASLDAAKKQEERLEQTLVELSQNMVELRKAGEESRAAMIEAERASRAKDDFLAALSHELRTPLTPVLMTAAALESDPALPAETRSQLAMMRRNIELEARLIDDLLDLTRISRGKLQIAPAVTDLHLLLQHTVEIVRSDALGKQVAIEFIFEATRHHVRGDPTRLQQVFWNLLKNALKFTPTGGRVTVTTRNDEEGWMILSVDDTGVGISAEALPRIFNAFEQGDVAGHHRYGGLGLGLAISRAIVEAHCGIIQAASAGPGRGASFTVALATIDTPAEAASGSDLAPPLTRALRLLVVEDHDATRTVLSRLLTRNGHKITTAATIQEALTAFAAEHFDVVISDLGLPDGSGLDLMRELLRQRPIFGIALSGYGMEDDVRQTKEAGYFAHLVKPVNLDQLRRLLFQLPDSQ